MRDQSYSCNASSGCFTFGAFGCFAGFTTVCIPAAPLWSTIASFGGALTGLASTLYLAPNQQNQQQNEVVIDRPDLPPMALQQVQSVVIRDGDVVLVENLDGSRQLAFREGSDIGNAVTEYKRAHQAR